MTETKNVVSWLFERKNGRDGEVLTYSRAVAVFDDETERIFDVNDVVLCIVDDDERWVAQVVRFCIDRSYDDDEKRRVELRWMYYGEHMDEETVEERSARRPLPSSAGGVTEVSYSEHIDDYTQNSVGIIAGKAFLHTSLENMEEKKGDINDFQKGDRHMLCRTFYLHIIGDGDDAKGPVLRKLLIGELEYLLRNAGPHAMWDHFANAGDTRRQYQRAVYGNMPMPGDYASSSFAAAVGKRTINKRRVVEYVNGEQVVRPAKSKKKTAAEYNDDNSRSITALIYDTSTKAYSMPPGADLD